MMKIDPKYLPKIKKVIITIKDNPDRNYESLIFETEGGIQRGHGYQSKKEGSLICVEYCPQCNRENYALAIATGYCGFCNFNPNKQADIGIKRILVK